MDDGSVAFLPLDRIHQIVQACPEDIAVASLTLRENSRPETDNDDAASNMFDEVRITYKELWDSAKLLATRIKAACSTSAPGIEHQHTVVTFVEEGWELPLSFLSIVLASAVFVPLNINDPAERLAAVVADCRASAFLCCGYQAAAVRSKLSGVCFSALRHIPQIVIQEEARPGAVEAMGDQEAPNSMGYVEGDNVNPEQPAGEKIAYIIFTSGSSGAPKGVVVDHCALATYCESRAALEPGVAGQKDRLLVATAATWDPALGEIFTALSNGAVVCLAPRSQLLDDFAAVLVSSQATHAFATPSLWNLVQARKADQHLDFEHDAAPEDSPNGVSFELASAFPALRCLALGGEPIPWTLIHRWVVPGSKRLLVWNVYGLTEATVVQTALSLNSFLEHRIAQSAAGTTGTDNASGTTCSCIGTPMLNCNIALLPVADDCADVAKSCGIRGEICIQGSQLSRGYLNDPTLTQSRFCEEKDLAPICCGGESKLHSAYESSILMNQADRIKCQRSTWLRTGDVGWWDGHRLHVIGRLDNQVKFRGRRVDLGEVDAALAATSAVTALIRQAATVILPAGVLSSISQDMILTFVVPCAELLSLLQKDEDNHDNRLEIASPGSARRFFSLGPGTGGTSLQLFCRQRVPAYMIPARFVAVSDIPLGRTGKLDLVGLRAEYIEHTHLRAQQVQQPQQLQPTSTEECATSPNNTSNLTEDDLGRGIVDSLDEDAGAVAEIEAIVGDVWREVLGLSEIGPYDNFFHLGGTSIQALAMVNLLRVRLQKTAAQFDQSVAHAKVRFCGLNRKPRLRHYASFIAWMSMTAPNASPEAAASFGAVLDDKLATDVYDTDISSSGAVSTESRRIHGQHKAEELLYALDEAMPAESDTRDVAAHAMRAAAAGGALSVIRFMMDAGLCNADGFVTRKHQGTTPLSVAIRNGRDATVRYLLQKGANVNFHDDQWLSPLHVAAGVTRPARLKPNEAKGQMTAKESRVQYAQDANVSGSVEDDVSIVQLLVEAKAAVRARDHTRWTPLHYAAWAGRDSTVRCLLDLARAGKGMEDEVHAGSATMKKRSVVSAGRQQADAKRIKEFTNLLNAKDRWSRTALSWAVFRNHVAVVRQLLERGASLRAKLPMGSKGKRRKVPQKRHLGRANNTWSTILQLSLQSPWRSCGDTDILQLLLEAKADPTECGSTGKSGIDTATEQQQRRLESRVETEANPEDQPNNAGAVKIFGNDVAAVPGNLVSQTPELALLLQFAKKSL